MSNLKKSNIRCPYCGSFKIESSEDDYDYKSGFWWGVFGSGLLGFLAGLYGDKKPNATAKNAIEISLSTSKMGFIESTISSIRPQCGGFYTNL